MALFKVMEDLIVALKIVTPSNAKNTAASTSEENKENIQLSSTSAEDKSNEVQAMDVEQSETNNEATDKNETKDPTTSTAEVEMVSDVDCSISEND